MAKFLAYKRGTQQIVLIDTAALTITVLGPALAGMETTSTYPGRSQDPLIIHRTEPYILVLAAGFSVLLLRFDGASWVATTLTIAPATGSLTPSGLVKIHDGTLDMLIAIVLEDGGASPRIRAAWSSDPTAASVFTDSPIIALGLGRAGHIIAHGGVVHISTNRGLWYFQPGLGAGDGFNTAAPYSGDDGVLIAPATVLGCFARWRDRLYFAQPRSPIPFLYELTGSFNGLTFPVPGPANPWFNKLVTGLPNPGAITVANDGSASCLFVNDIDELCYFYSGASGTFLASTNRVSFPMFSNRSANILPAEIASITDAGIHLLEDTRRRTNPIHDFIIKDRTAGKTYLVSWDSINPMVIEAVLDSASAEFIVPQSQRGDLAVYMDEMPAIIGGVVTELFRGNYDINYTLIDTLSRLCSISPEFTVDGVNYLPMSEGETGDGIADLSSSPAGDAHIFNWSATADLRGERLRDFRIIARISGP